MTAASSKANTFLFPTAGQKQTSPYGLAKMNNSAVKEKATENTAEDQEMDQSQYLTGQVVHLGKNNNTENKNDFPVQKSSFPSHCISKAQNPTNTSSKQVLSAL